MGYSISDAENSMTIFYSCTTGKIKAVCGGIQTMDYFGEDKYDYNYDILINEYDLNIILNMNNFKIIDNKLQYSPNIPTSFMKYNTGGC